MTELVIHARDVDEPTMAQIRDIASHPAVDGLVAIMPDCHLGAGCVIGFTGRFKGAVIPNVVGVDIGCGVLLAPLEGVKKGDVDFAALDGFIRGSIPLGKTRHRGPAMLDWFESRFPGRGARAKELGELADDDFRHMSFNAPDVLAFRHSVLLYGFLFIPFSSRPPGRYR